MATDIDSYLANLDNPRRATLEQLRADIMSIVPEAEEGMSYSVPAFRLQGKLIAGFSSAAKHLSFLPHSGTVLESVQGNLEGYKWSKGALKFAVDQPLPKALVEVLIAARRKELGI